MKCDRTIDVKLRAIALSDVELGAIAFYGCKVESDRISDVE
ncbi:hypothetical protein [Anabaena sphaerica]|nr:hypothetical protein [Anabaena sphaerica]